MTVAAQVASSARAATDVVIHNRRLFLNPEFVRKLCCFNGQLTQYSHALTLAVFTGLTNAPA